MYHGRLVLWERGCREQGESRHTGRLELWERGCREQGESRHTVVVRDE
jgi:hypothetical protein